MQLCGGAYVTSRTIFQINRCIPGVFAAGKCAGHLLYNALLLYCHTSLK